MRAEARKRFRNARPGKCSECHKWIKCNMYRHVATIGLGAVVAVPDVLVHGVEGHATGLHGSCSGGA